MSEQEDRSMYPEFDNLDLTELAKEMKRLGDDLKASDDKTKAIRKKYDYLRKVLIPETMSDKEILGMKVAGVGRISLRPEAYTQVVDKESLHRWLVENDLGDMIRPEVPSSTLKAFAKEQIKNGGELPPEEVFKFTPFMQASITKG